MTRYARLWPPPLCRVVMRPWLLRPPFFGSGRTSDFSGVDRVTSTKSATEEPRRPGVVGLYLRIAISSLDLDLCSSSRSAHRAEDVDPLTLGQTDDSAFGVGPLACSGSGTTGLALPVERVDGGDLDVEHLLDRDLDLGLVGIGVHQEGVLVDVEEAIALLTHDRRDQHVAVVLVEGTHLVAPCSAPSRVPVLVATRVATNAS